MSNIQRKVLLGKHAHTKRQLPANLQVAYRKYSEMLTPDQRKMFEMYYGLGNKKVLTQRKIAEKLGVTQGNISLMRRRVERCLLEGHPTSSYERKDGITPNNVPWDAIKQHVRKLGKPIATVLRARYKEYKTTTEIAEEMGLSQPQIQAMSSAGLELVRQEEMK